MKCKQIIPGLLISMMLGGCIPAGTAGNPDETGAGTKPPQTVAYQETILQLQQELQNLRAAQLLQNAAYEERIAELETLLAKSDEQNRNPEPDVTLFSYIEVDGGVILTSYHGSETKLSVPAQLDGKNVIGIGESAFRNSALVSVMIPEGVRTVDWFAFYGSYRLSSVTLPASVSSIAYGAFELCDTSLHITCPENSYAAQYAKSYGIPVIKTSAVEKNEKEG